MKKMLLFAIFIFFFTPLSSFASQSWFYPMTQIQDRATVKGFGMYINSNFYSTHSSSEFPNHFYGYHAAQDLETFQNEKPDSVDVPVYFVTSGTISYIGSLEGYGGVVLLKIDGTNETALYGHVRISGINYKVGEHITADKPTVLTYLGDGFSSETSGERKHLHFAIHKGQDLYFHGHEATKQILNAKWYNPLDYLKDKDAKEIGNEPQKVPSPAPTATYQPQHQSLLEKIISLLMRI